MSYPTATPLILTLALDDAAQTYFNALRREHFPPKINHLEAHLTLFHHLPGSELEAMCEQLHRYCLTQCQVQVQVTGLRSLGRGARAGTRTSGHQICCVSPRDLPLLNRGWCWDTTAGARLWSRA